MEVKCPQCQTKQKLSMEEASRFWAMCSACGVVHGPATAKAGEASPQTPAPTPLGEPCERAAEWAAMHEMFEDILMLEGKEAEGDAPDTEPRLPEDVCGAGVVHAAEPPAQPTLQASPETETHDDGGARPAAEEQDVIHLSLTPEEQSGFEAEMPLPVPPAPFDRPAPAANRYNDGAGVLRISPVWLLGEGVSRPAVPPDQPAVNVSHETDADDEGGAHSTPEAPDVLHLSRPPENQSRPEVEAAPPPPPAPLRRPVPSPHGPTVGARIRRRAPVSLLIGGIVLLSVLVIAIPRWTSEPDGKARSQAAPTASGAPKTVATNQSPTHIPSPPPASVNSAPKSVETAAPAGQGAETQTGKAAEAVAAAPTPAREHDGGEGGGNFTAQVASYSNVSDANALISRLRAAGFEARAVEAEIPGRGVWYRVQCGRFGTRDEAVRFGAQLRSKGFAREVIITEVQKR